MSQHTPGPWRTAYLDIIGKDGTIVATANKPHGDMSGVAFRDARLIAAAPELLAALDEAIPYLEYLASNGSGNEDAAKTVRTAWAVVAKARGTS